MNTHIDTLTAWWENAEVPTRATLPKDGDQIIIRYNSKWYEIATADGDVDEHDLAADTRILARAPKPKPAWHDAVAVVANHRDYADERRTVWVQVGGDEYDRVNIEGDTAAEHHLVNVTPLIEAEVTGAMIDRILDVIAARFDNYPAGIGQELALAALGIGAE